MSSAPSAAHRRLRDEIVAFARAELGEGAVERDRDEVFPRDLWRTCGTVGLQGLVVPREHGGRGLDPESATVALEALGYACPDGGLAFALCAHLLACVVPIWKHGTEAQKRRWLPGLCDGSLIAGNGMTEAGSGSDAFALATRAVPDGDGFRLTGAKSFVSNGPVADLIVNYAATPGGTGYAGGVTAFLVPTDTPGVRTGQSYRKMGLRSCPLGEIVFEDAAVGAEAVLGRVGGGASVFAESMDWERACLVAVHVGTMHRLLERTVAHARTHERDGRRLGKLQRASHRIADMKVRLDAARLLVRRAASRLEESRDVGLDAAVAKLFVSEALIATARDALEVLGPDALREGEVERALRDAAAATLYSGTSEIQRDIIGRWLGL